VSPEHVQVHTADGVTTVTLDRPHALNALNQQMTAELVELFADLATDERTRAVILTGAGRGFCAGADVGDLAELAGADLRPGEMRRLMLAGSGRLARALHGFEKPIVAAVNGPCAGAGVGLALAADFLLAASDATFSIVFAHRGLVPDYGVTYWLPRIVGLQRARELCLLGERLLAEEAAAAGLVTRVVAPEELLREAGRLGARLAAGAGTALGLTRRLLNDSFDSDYLTASDREWSAQALCFASADAAEGAMAFLEKRPAQFRGR
jgi:2-(1,2-epoxy-1,2-dihydrophenyl)acetyl-CoA isomerase